MAEDPFFDQQSAFFARQPETDYLRTRVQSSGVTIVASAPKMGKSWLIRQFAQELVDRAPTSADPGFLVGYHECTGGEEFLRYTLQDLYTRWLDDASFREQAKQVWEQQKGGLLTTAAKAVGSLFSEVSKWGGEAHEGVGNLVKDSLDGLISANEKLKSGGLDLPYLAYDQGRDLTATLAKISGRSLVLLFDGWENAGDLSRERSFLETFLKHRPDWPRVHIIAALRHPDVSENAGDPSWRAAQQVCQSSPAAALFELPPLHLDDAAEQSKLLGFLRARLPQAAAIADPQLLDLLAGYPGTLERWAELPQLATADQLAAAADDAAAFRYRELDALLRTLSSGGITLIIRLTLLPGLSAGTWPLFRPLVEKELEPDGWIACCESGVLASAEYPTFGHDTRRRAAVNWFMAPEQAAFRPRLWKEANGLMLGLGAAMAAVTPDLVILSNALAAIAGRVTSGWTPLARAVVLANAAYRQQSPGPALPFSPLWQPAGAQALGVARLLGAGLFNVLIDAQAAKDVPAAAGLLRELALLQGTFPDEPAVRRYLAMALVNSLNFAAAQGDGPRYPALFLQLRALEQRYPTDAAVQEEGINARYNEIRATRAPGAFAAIPPLMEEVLVAPPGSLPESAAETVADALLWGVAHALAAPGAAPFVVLWLEELRRRAAPPQVAIARRAATAYKTASAAAFDAGDRATGADRFEALQTLQSQYPRDPAIAASLAELIVHVVATTPWQKVLPGLRDVLATLGQLHQGFPDEQRIRETIANLQAGAQQLGAGLTGDQPAAAQAFYVQLCALTGDSPAL